MRIIFGIIFAVLVGLIGARFAGWFVDWLLGTQTFVSPDQVAQFDLIARIGVTLVAAIIGAIIGVIIGGQLKRRAIQHEI